MLTRQCELNFSATVLSNLFSTVKIISCYLSSSEPLTRKKKKVKRVTSLFPRARESDGCVTWVAAV